MRNFVDSIAAWLADRKGEIEMLGQGWAAPAWTIMLVSIVGGGGTAALASSHMNAHQALVHIAVAFSDKLDSEAQSAWSVTVPPLDVFGNPNTGQQISFFVRTTCTPAAPCGPLGRGQDLFWHYYFNAAAHTLTEYKNEWTGSGFTQPVQYGTSIKNVYSMTAVVVKATERVNSSSPYYLPPLAPVAGMIKDISCSYGFTDYMGTNATVQYDIKFGTTGTDGEAFGILGQQRIYCAQGQNFVAWYTPTPAPSPTPAALPVVFPAAIEFAAPGSAVAVAATRRLATARRQQSQLAVGAFINGLFAGGIADATRGCGLDCPKVTPTPRATVTPRVTPTPTASSVPTSTPLPTSAPTSTPTVGPTSTPAPTGACTAIAYADAGMTQRLSPGTTNPYTGAVVVDPNGCYTGSGNSADITVHEDGYTNSFFDGPNACGSALSAGAWSPTSGPPNYIPAGPTESQLFTASSATSGVCSVTFSDANGKQAQTAIDVVGNCATAQTTGGKCYATMTFTPPKSCGEDGNPVVVYASSYTVTPTAAATYDASTGVLTSYTNAPFTLTASFRYFYEVYDRFYNGCVGKTWSGSRTWTFN